MGKEYERLLKCLDCVRAKTDFRPKTALILGSGLGDYGESIQLECTMDYSEIEGFPVSTVPGHKGRFLFGFVKGVPVVAMQGRVHYYEAFAPGDLMLIRDQISDFVPSPLIGENIEEFGPRFPDMSHIYDEGLQGVLRDGAAKLGIPLKEGVYLQFTGPNYESPAEIRMSRILGADAVGMSTACEAIAANHMGMKICGISCISNMAAGISEKPLNHQEVQQAADRVAPLFKKLVTESIYRMGKL